MNNNRSPLLGKKKKNNISYPNCMDDINYRKQQFPQLYNINNNNNNNNYNDKTRNNNNMTYLDHVGHISKRYSYCSNWFFYFGFVIYNMINIVTHFIILIASNFH